MNFKESVENYSKILSDYNAVKEDFSIRKEAFEKENFEIIQNINDLKKKVEEIENSISSHVLNEFENDKTVKKFFGGIGVQERQKIEYDSDKALSWALEKNMFLVLDTKSFEKAAEGLKLDFVSIKKEPKVTFPKVIKLED